MQVVQTAGPPPNQGRMSLQIRGWTWNSRKAPARIAPAKTQANQPGASGFVAALAIGRRPRIAARGQSIATRDAGESLHGRGRPFHDPGVGPFVRPAPARGDARAPW